MKKQLLKTDSRKALEVNEIIDIFCQGGESSKKFHNAPVGETVNVTVLKINDRRNLSNYRIYYLD